MPTAWKTLTVPTRHATQFSFAAIGEVVVTAANSVAFLYKKVDNADRPATVAWRWRVDDNIPPTDQTVKGGDDRPVAVHFWFDTGDHTNTRFGSVAEFFGYPTLTHTLTYVWGGVRSEGSLLGNPYFRNGALFILKDRSARLGHWYDERRDLAGDLRQAFGDAVGLEHLRYVAISGDTDDTATRSQARVAALRLIDAGDAR